MGLLSLASFAGDRDMSNLAACHAQLAWEATSKASVMVFTPLSWLVTCSSLSSPAMKWDIFTYSVALCSKSGMTSLTSQHISAVWTSIASFDSQWQTLGNVWNDAVLSFGQKLPAGVSLFQYMSIEFHGADYPTQWTVQLVALWVTQLLTDVGRSTPLSLWCASWTTS